MSTTSPSPQYLSDSTSWPRRALLAGIWLTWSVVAGAVPRVVTTTSDAAPPPRPQPTTEVYKVETQLSSRQSDSSSSSSSTLIEIEGQPSRTIPIASTNANSQQQQEEEEEENGRQQSTEPHQHYQSTTIPTRSSNRMPYLRQEQLPIEKVQEKWQSLSTHVEFVPADEMDAHVVGRFLEQHDGENYNSYNSNYDDEDAEDEDSQLLSQSAKYQRIYGVEPFSYGNEEYDEYQQAWRLLGFIIDCNPLVDDDYYANDGSGDQQGTEDGCARYVLWAAVRSRT